MSGHPAPRARPPLGVLALLVLATVQAAGAGRGSPVALDLALDVVWGDESMGPESLREEVERRVLARLTQVGCYASVSRSRPSSGADPVAPDLVLRLTLSDLEVREDWDVSIAERTSPDQPPGESETQVQATVGFDVSMDLSLLPEAIPLRTRAYRHEEHYRPLHDEDPREAVRLMVLDDLARETSAFACKGTAKLPAQIARARATAVD